MKNMTEAEREVAMIKEEILYIGRYLGQVSPKLYKYNELQTRKAALKRKLKELGASMGDQDHKKM